MKILSTVNTEDLNPSALIAELKRRDLDYLITKDGTAIYIAGRNDARSFEPWVIEYVEELHAAIEAMTIQQHGLVRYRTRHDIPMDMPKKVEKIVRRALRYDNKHAKC